MNVQRHLVLVSLTAVLIISSAQYADAQDYPARAVTFVAPFPAGGVADVAARMLAQRLSDRLGKPVVVENRSGAGAVIAAASVARAGPDGYTLLLGGTPPFAIAPGVWKKLPYDPVNDFVPVARINDVPFILVTNPSLPAHTVTDLIKLARDRPGQLAYASPGPGTGQHLASEMLKTITGIDMRHVPYRGDTNALMDVVAGRVPLMFAAPSALPIVAEGKVRALAVSSKTRLSALPTVPTIAEAGISGFDVVVWTMVVAPAQTPKNIVDRLHVELKDIAAESVVKGYFIKNGLIPVDSPPVEELQRFMKSEVVRWGSVAQQVGLAGSQ
jgi:tripartite-type tricarboxylate transporter receptor subunit TctC